MPLNRIALTALIYLLFAFPGLAWWETGHRTVARVAARHLSPAARKQIAAIFRVRNTPQAVADAMAVASTWADETKAQTHTGNWHYTDLAVTDAETDLLKRCPAGNCATIRIEIFGRQLSSHASPRAGDLEALRYLIHLVGDVHQPLHTISDADQGGNCEAINPLEGAVNLHALWDGGIVRAIDPSGRRLARKLDLYISRLSERQTEEWSSGDPREWTWESHQLARRVIYNRLHIPIEPPVFPKSCADAPLAIRDFRPSVDSLYMNDMKPIVRDQLAKGGLRLATLLNRAFGRTH